MVTRTVDESENWCHMGVKWLQPIGPNPSRMKRITLKSVHHTFTPYVFTTPITWDDVRDMYHKMTPDNYKPDVSTPMHMDGPQ